MVEIVLTMFCTLIPYLHIEDVDEAEEEEEQEEEEEKQKNNRHAFNIWGMEIFDMVSQIVVIQTYCRQNPSDDDWTQVLKGYFALLVVELIVLTVGSHLMFLVYDRHVMDLKKFVVAHELVMDAVTDIPFFLVSMVGGTYVGNVWITIDMVLKGIMLVRGAIWVPCNLDEVQLTEVEPQKESELIREQTGKESNANLKEKIAIVCCFVILAAGVVVGFYFYLKW